MKANQLQWYQKLLNLRGYDPKFQFLIRPNQVIRFFEDFFDGAQLQESLLTTTPMLRALQMCNRHKFSDS